MPRVFAPNALARSSKPLSSNHNQSHAVASDSIQSINQDWRCLTPRITTARGTEIDGQHLMDCQSPSLSYIASPSSTSHHGCQSPSPPQSTIIRLPRPKAHERAQTKNPIRCVNLPSSLPTLQTPKSAKKREKTMYMKRNMRKIDSRS